MTIPEKGRRVVKGKDVTRLCKCVSFNSPDTRGFEVDDGLVGTESILLNADVFQSEGFASFIAD